MGLRPSSVVALFIFIHEPYKICDLYTLESRGSFNVKRILHLNIYHKKTRWKYLLAIAGILILAVSTYYTYFLAKKLIREEKDKVELWVIANREIVDESFDCSATLHERVMSSNFHIPVLIYDEQMGIILVRNFKYDDPSDPRLIEELEGIKQNGPPPIPIVTKYFTQYVYYKESRLLQMLSFFPLIQVLLVSAFIAIGYWLFSTAWRSEQELVWVGMAKETAHQLGTPITAIMSWLDLLKENLQDSDDLDIAEEMETDVRKLELIAARFSKIGSKPNLKLQDVSNLLTNNVSYFEKRKPKNVEISVDVPSDLDIQVAYNEELLNWVIENIIRNALDALPEGRGEIRLSLRKRSNWASIEISDTGHGMSSKYFKKIFQPGYSTKKRGWGLGLSLAKRIVENYHKGKIYVKNSHLNQGTVIAIDLPL